MAELETSVFVYGDAEAAEADWQALEESISAGHWKLGNGAGD
jgi:hypothetical protein